MSDDLKDTVAEKILALMPHYHRHIFQAGAGISGVQNAQYRVLGLLRREGPLPMTEIGKKLYISKPSMTALADNLAEKGLIERHDDPDDRRITRISITASGKKSLQHLFSVYKANVRDLLVSLDVSDLERLRDSLEEVQTVFAKLERS